MTWVFKDCFGAIVDLSGETEMALLVPALLFRFTFDHGVLSNSSQRSFAASDVEHYGDCRRPDQDRKQRPPQSSRVMFELI